MYNDNQLLSHVFYQPIQIMKLEELFCAKKISRHTLLSLYFMRVMPCVRYKVGSFSLAQILLCLWMMWTISIYLKQAEV